MVEQNKCVVCGEHRKYFIYFIDDKPVCKKHFDQMVRLNTIFDNINCKFEQKIWNEVVAGVKSNDVRTA